MSCNIEILSSFFIYIRNMYRMNEKEKLTKTRNLNENFDDSLSEIYEKLTNAINTNNLQSIYELSKIITRYYSKKLED